VHLLFKDDAVADDILTGSVHAFGVRYLLAQRGHEDEGPSARWLRYSRATVKRMSSGTPFPDFNEDTTLDTAVVEEARTLLLSSGMTRTLTFGSYRSKSDSLHSNSRPSRLRASSILLEGQGVQQEGGGETEARVVQGRAGNFKDHFRSTLHSSRSAGTDPCLDVSHWKVDSLLLETCVARLKGI